MFIVYAEFDKDGEVCKPYTGREYYTHKEAEKELDEAMNDTDVYLAWIEEV